jgi:DNA repair exonuclease SbcCD ATPase subunit
VLQKRLGHEEETDGSLLAGETMRSAAGSAAAVNSSPKEDEKMSLFWRVFGGTILSIAALGSITLYNSISTNISELRGELNREREARAELVKKDEFNSRTSNQYERMRSFDGLKAEHEALKERISANASVLDSLKKEFAPTLDAVKKDAAALEVLKERLTALEAVKKEIAGIDLLKERLTAIATDLKASRDDLARLQQEVERNRAGDAERKASRDAQFKQVEETLKELQKGLQFCREKVARLEGVQPGGGVRSPLLPMGVPATKTGKPVPPDGDR